jgi:hypothetical protein
MNNEILLADRLIEFSETYCGPLPLQEDFRYVARQIKMAQRFVVSPDVRSAIRSLLTSRPSTLIEAARFAKLPYEKCWFEWTPPGEANIHANQVAVRRCGAMLEPYGPHGFTIWTAWEFSRQDMLREFEREIKRLHPLGLDIDRRMMPACGVSSLVGAYDLSSFVLPVLMNQDKEWKWFQQRELSSEEMVGMRDDVRNPIKWAIKDPKEMEALKMLAGRAAFRVHAETNGEGKIGSQQMLEGDVASVMHDVQDEMGHLFATLILMNSKNCINVAKTEPPVQLNKARRKRGKPELLPYSTVHIELSQSQQRAVASGVMTHEEARRHLVRGHFKVRATGVFWWGEFMRGNAAHGIIERSAHIIHSKEATGGGNKDQHRSR